MNKLQRAIDTGIEFLKRVKRRGIKLGESLDYYMWKSRYMMGGRRRKKAVIIRENRMKQLQGRTWDAFLKDIQGLNDKVKIGLVVTEAGEHVTAGDYFTALELSISLEKLGFEVVFIERLKEEWYQVAADVDVIISLLESYDIRRLGDQKDKIIKVAWARNWFEAWSEQPWIQEYDYVLASSEKAVEYMQERLSREVHLLKIGTNVDRFNDAGALEEKFQCDYCFTGSYWNEPREIMDALSPEYFGEYRFHLYGANWENFEKFRMYNRGFVDYHELPKIYRNTKILIDDANRVTKPFGSVNSRVFDALASGVLVFTNGEIGARNTFGAELPTYESAEDLRELLGYYLEQEQEREQLVEQLQEYVRKYHSYDCRAKELVEILLKK